MQAAYSELYFDEKLWPDFTNDDFITLISGLKRKKGDLVSSNAITIHDPKKNPHDLVVGIDLGTTHSLVSWVDNEKVRLMSWQDKSHYLLPSIATYNKKGDVKLGFDALKNPLESGLLASTKRLMEEPNQYIWGKITPIKVAQDLLEYMKEKQKRLLIE